MGENDRDVSPLEFQMIVRTGPYFHVWRVVSPEENRGSLLSVCVYIYSMLFSREPFKLAARGLFGGQISESLYTSQPYLIIKLQDMKTLAADSDPQVNFNTVLRNFWIFSSSFQKF